MVGNPRAERGAAVSRPTRDNQLPEVSMTNRTYRVTEIVGTSPDGIEEAIRNGVDRAARTLRHLDWFEVTQVRGQVKDGSVEHFQVGMKVGFRLEDD
jgi:flavin-binding protein dodecin